MSTTKEASGNSTTSGTPEMLVFREGRQVCSARELLQGLEAAVAALLRAESAPQIREKTLDALLRSGELECSLADAASGALSVSAVLTDLLAGALFSKISPEELKQQMRQLASAHLPEGVIVSLPEGFAYYALHPLDYVEALKSAQENPEAAAVIGIRSIGVTLSAVVRAYFSSRGTESSRITVRPEGHPFDRRLEFTPEQNDWIQHCIARRAIFYVVDEGPGLSGSSFLATAEALVRAGVPAPQIALLCSSQPDLSALLAPDAAQRWQRFRTLPSQASSQLPAEAKIFFGAGRWRERCFANPEEWPACWIQMERVKFLSEDSKLLFRFDGLGKYGAPVRARDKAVADAGFGPACEDAGSGFTRFPMIEGVTVSAVSRELIQRAAEYCVFRASEIRREAASSAALEEMARINIERELGHSLERDFRLEIVRPVIADGKMMLHEWLAPAGQKILKLDSAAHGDDHFFPGPTDIAWDLAGATVEWNLDAGEAEQFIAFYQQPTKDHVLSRLHNYQIAYAAFRMGYTKMAAFAMRGSEEEGRMWREYGFYRQALTKILSRSSGVLSVQS